MTKIPEPTDPTLTSVGEAIVRANNFDEPRDYAGGSTVGEPCARKYWGSWRWVLPNRIDAQGLRNIADGNAGETVMADRLKAVSDITLLTEGPDEKQWEVVALVGHLKGHLDGVIKGVFAAPKAWHVWEHKQVNQTKFNKLAALKKDGEKEALEKWDRVYFAQAQIYMGLVKKGPIERHYMTVATPGGRNYQSVRTNFQKDKFDAMMATAKERIESAEPPEKISHDPSFYLCSWCHLKENCHGSETAAVNCRTCAHATPILSENAGAPGKLLPPGAWRCEFHAKTLSKKAQREGCSKHLFIPNLIPWAHVHTFDKINNQITYRTEKGTEFVNAEHNAWEKKPKHFASKDLQHINDYNIDNDDVFFSQMAQFSPSITKVEKASDDEELNDDIPF